MEQLYVFISDGLRACKPGAAVCLGHRAFVEQFIPYTEFEQLFGGYVISEDGDGSQFLGVWGQRVAGRFRRLLRERGAGFALSRQPPTLRLSRYGVYYPPPNHALQRTEAGLRVCPEFHA